VDGRTTTGLALGASLLCGLILPAYGAIEINYGYDDLNRLVSVTRADGPAIAYQYDAAGNFTSQGVSNSPDTDGDLIANFADPDDDNDGMPDAWEIQYGLNPLDPADAAQDADGDGLTNLAEYQAGSHPLVADASTDADIPFVPGWGLLVLAASLMGIAIRQAQGRGV
jgi:YD repeat-containing protein